MSFDQLTVGEDKGLGGGICNVVYFPASMNYNYKLLKIIILLSFRYSKSILYHGW